MQEQLGHYISGLTCAGTAGSLQSRDADLRMQAEPDGREHDALPGWPYPWRRPTQSDLVSWEASLLLSHMNIHTLVRRWEP